MAELGKGQGVHGPVYEGRQPFPWHGAPFTQPMTHSPWSTCSSGGSVITSPDSPHTGPQNLPAEEGQFNDRLSSNWDLPESKHVDECLSKKAATSPQPAIEPTEVDAHEQHTGQHGTGAPTPILQATRTRPEPNPRATSIRIQPSSRATFTGAPPNPRSTFTGAQPTCDSSSQVYPSHRHTMAPPKLVDPKLMAVLNRPLFSASDYIDNVNAKLKRQGSTFTYTCPPELKDPQVCNLSNMNFQPKQSGLLQETLRPQPTVFAGLEDADRTKKAGDDVCSREQHTTIERRRETDQTSSTPLRHEHFYRTFRSNMPKFSSDLSVPPPTPFSTSLPQSVLQLINCPLCHQTYKWPHLLKCLHVFCLPCLTARFEPTDKGITCPICDFRTCVPDGPCSLNMDAAAVRQMLAMNVSPFACTACTRGYDAVIHCTTCAAYLCPNCHEGHRNMNIFANHCLAPITKLRQNFKGDWVYLCAKHPAEELSHYCCACISVICRLCLSEHAHPEFANCCSSLEDIYPIMVESLKTYKQDCDVKCEELSDIVKAGPYSQQQMAAEERQLMKQFHDYVEYTHFVAQQNVRQAYQVVRMTLAHMATESRDWVNRADTINRELEACKFFSMRTMALGTIPDNVICFNVTDSAYKRGMANYTNVIKDKDKIWKNLRFTPNYKETHDILNNNFLCLGYSVDGVSYDAVPQADLLEMQKACSLLDSPVTTTSCSKYTNWTTTADSMAISTWKPVNEQEKNTGTFVPHLKRHRIKTAYIRQFGEFGRGEYSFTEPSGQAYLKDGSYVICDTNNHRILYYNAEHEYVRTIGQPPNLPPLNAESEQRGRAKGFARQQGCLYYPNRVAICPKTQNIIATERAPSHDIQIFTAAGDFLRCFGGSILQHPRGVVVDEDGVIIVVECKIMKLVMFRQDGGLIVSHSLGNSLEFPNDIAVKDKKIFISDNRSHCVHVYNYNAEPLYKIGGDNITCYPIGVSINHLNQVVVTDNHNTFNITVFDLEGKVVHHVFESVNKLAQCHGFAVHPTKLELMLTSRDCCVYIFSYDPGRDHSFLTSAGQKPANAASGTVIKRL